MNENKEIEKNQEKTELRPDSISKFDVQHRENRGVQNINDLEKILYIIKNHLYNHTIFVKGYPKQYSVKITQVIDDKTVELLLSPHIKAEDKITIYAMLNKYVEVDLKHLKHIESNLYHFEIIGSNIATSDRETQRINLESGDAFINNIKTSKNIINATEYTVPTSVKVVMHQFEPELKNLTENVKLLSFDKADLKHKLIFKTLRIFYIRDTQDDNAYELLNQDFIDVKKFFNNDITKAKRFYQQKKIRSEILTPIIYLTFEEKPILLGIIQMFSSKDPLEIDKVLDAKELSFKIVDKVRIANTLTIKKRQEILDISLGGAKILINDAELKKMLIHQEGFVFDLYFRMQAPITLYGKIKNSFYDKDKNLIIGIDFQGRSSRKDEIKRLHEIFKFVKEKKESQD